MSDPRPIDQRARMSVDQLLEQARLNDTGLTRQLALGIRNQAIALDNALTRERNTHRMGALRRELHGLEISLGIPSPTAAVGSIDYDPTVVRAWAKANHWQPPARGRYLPLDLIDAWRAATAVAS